MYFDTGTFINLIFIFSLIVASRSFITFYNKPNFKIKYAADSSSIQLVINYFKRLVIEDYLTFEKYEVWRYTTFKEIPSKI